ncbi:MAG: histidinol-phosphate transaminase [Fibrobacter sp.]|jgi:histidinol-phosphate aminotransferase|nr:histidinol-phosphate transaminase [Fibrobacter sp.]
MIEPRPELGKLSDYVPGKSIEEIQNRYHLDRVIKLASNENTLGVSPRAKRAYEAAADSFYLYPRGEAPQLLSALAEKYGVEKSQIIIGNGSDEVIEFVARAFVREGDTCLGIAPTFSVYRFAVLAAGGNWVQVEASSPEEKPSVVSILSQVTPEVRVLFLCSPNNPTGWYYSEAEIETLLKNLSPETLLFLDEAYAEFAEASDFPDSFSMIRKYPNLLVSRTFSKIYGLAGLRVGYALGNAEVVRHLWKIKPPFDVNSAVQAAAVAVLSDREYFEQSLKLVRRGKEQLIPALSAMGFSVQPTQANFICVKIGAQAMALVEFLEQNGVIIRPLKSFKMDAYVRITIGTSEENAVLLSLISKWREENKNG